MPRPSPVPLPIRALAAACALAWVLAWALGAAGAARAQQADGPAATTYITEQYYPYSYTADGTVRGLSADLLRLVWRHMGVAEQPIQVQPWARAYEAGRTRPGTVVFGMARTPGRERLFKWACPIDTVRFALFARAADKARILVSADMKTLVVGTVRDDVAEAALLETGRPVRIEPVADMELNLRKLDAGRLDLVAYEARSMPRLLRSLGRDPAGYAEVVALGETETCYAFHRDTADEVVARFQRALDAVRAGPEYARLRRLYLE